MNLYVWVVYCGCWSVEIVRTVFHDCSTVVGTFYIVKLGSPLLGMDLLKALHCCFVGNTVITNENHEVDSSGFIHKVKVKKDFASVQQKLRRLPLSVRQAVLYKPVGA